MMTGCFVQLIGVVAFAVYLVLAITEKQGESTFFSYIIFPHWPFALLQSWLRMAPGAITWPASGASWPGNGALCCSTSLASTAISTDSWMVCQVKLAMREFQEIIAESEPERGIREGWLAISYPLPKDATPILLPFCAYQLHSVNIHELSIPYTCFDFSPFEKVYLFAWMITRLWISVHHNLWN